MQSPGHLKTLQPPLPAWGPPCAPSWLWGWAGLATGACQAGLRVPQGGAVGWHSPVGLAQERGVTLEGAFATQRKGSTSHPQICSAVPAFSCWGS